MAPHSSTLAWKIPGTEGPGGLQSMGLRRVRHDWVTSLSLFTFMHWRRKWQPTAVFLPGESQDGVAQSQTRLKWLSSSTSSYHSLISFPLSLQNESPLYTICFFRSLPFSTFNSNTTQSFFFFWKLILWEINGHKHLKIYHEKSHFHKKFLSKGIRNYKYTHPTTVISPVSVCLI